jgi:hypothetical protein
MLRAVMPTTTVATLKAALTRERRTNRRLRAIVEQLREDRIHDRRDIDLTFKRLAQLQAEVDLLKRHV